MKTDHLSHLWASPRAFGVFEPIAGKLARSVLRGAGGGNAPVPTRSAAGGAQESFDA